MTFTRYGVYFTPPPGPFAKAGARWLGWDVATATAYPVAGPDLVSKPGKYGFHATMKPPFALAQGQSPTDLKDALAALAETTAPCATDGLVLSRLGGFFAFTLEGDSAPVDALAALAVQRLDRFRAPLTPSERARKARPGMRPELVRNLDLWGYPHVLSAFRFHMTLTGPVPPAARTAVRTRAAEHFKGVVPDRFVLDSLTLVGEGADGMFREIERFALTGKTGDQTKPK